MLGSSASYTMYSIPYVGKFWWDKIGEWANLNQLEDKILMNELLV